MMMCVLMAKSSLYVMLHPKNLTHHVDAVVAVATTVVAMVATATMTMDVVVDLATKISL